MTPIPTPHLSTLPAYDTKAERTYLRLALGLLIDDVGRVNSKATLRVPLQSLLPLVPPVLHSEIRASRFCSDVSGHVVIQAEDNRKQADNTQSCFAKLRAMILEAGQKVIPGETSQAQRARVRQLYDTLCSPFGACLTAD